jgi:(p)ppGpp synthase/HD superfamily hydrolase
MTKLEHAIDLAVRAHMGQIDKGDDMPHIVHCMEVMLAVKREWQSLSLADVPSFFTLEQLMIAAILHDTVEDSGENPTALVKLDLTRIEMTFGKEIAEIVDSVTRRKGEPYRDSIYRAKANPGGRLVKLADLIHNSGRTHQLKQASWRNKLQYKYSIALKVINDLDEPTWEGASYEVQYHDEANLRVPRFFIADPHGKRVEITKEEADHVKISFRISN